MITPASLGLTQDTSLAWHAGQWEAIEHILASTRPYQLINGPPGVGKTWIAVAVGKLTQSRSIYLTSTKQLQDQYAEIPEVVKVIGRPNFLCALDQLSASIGFCTIGGDCEHAGTHGTPGCDYFDQKRFAEDADHVVMNYSYALNVFHSWNGGSANEGEPDLLVCDEGHLIHGIMQDYISARIAWSTLARGLQLIGLTTPRLTSAGEWIAWATSAWPKVYTLFRDIQKQMDAHKGMSEPIRLMRLITPVHTFVGSVRDCGINQTVMLTDTSGLKIIPIWIGNSFTNFTTWAKKTIIMSATLGNSPEFFCKTLGIPIDQVDFHSIPSPFSPARRPIRYLPVGRVSGNIDYLHVIAAVDEILDYHMEEKGLVHTTNYTLAKAILGVSRHKNRLIGHDSTTRTSALAGHRLGHTNTVLVSPSMGVGVDLPYDECRFQIIVKIPFPGQDEVRKAQAKTPFGKRLAIYDTAMAMQQAYGRIMRAEDDYGVTYLIDENYSWFKHSAKDFLMPWWTEAVSTSTFDTYQ